MTHFTKQQPTQGQSRVQVRSFSCLQPFNCVRGDHVMFSRDPENIFDHERTLLLLARFHRIVEESRTFYRYAWMTSAESTNRFAKDSVYRRNTWKWIGRTNSFEQQLFANFPGKQSGVLFLKQPNFTYNTWSRYSWFTSTCSKETRMFHVPDDSVKSN